MHRTHHVPALLTGVLLAATVLAPAAAGSPLWGKYLQSCGNAVNAQVDPLVSPGAPVSDHPHTESGSRAFSSTMTTGDMYASTTTCNLTGNRSAYWTSAMRKDGVDYNASFSTYYAGAGSAILVQPMPTGLRFVVGNPNSHVIQSSSVVRWRCSHSTTTTTRPPTTCAPRPDNGQPDGVSVEFVAPNCWDGMRLDSPDHQAHMKAGGGGTCPVTHPVRVPQLQMGFAFPPAAVGGCPSSDDPGDPCGASAHSDVWEAQDPAQQEQATRCLNDPARNTPAAPLCGEFKSTTSPWLTSLNNWSGTIGYVKANGTANATLPPPTP